MFLSHIYVIFLVVSLFSFLKSSLPAPLFRLAVSMDLYSSLLIFLLQCPIAHIMSFSFALEFTSCVFCYNSYFSAEILYCSLNDHFSFMSLCVYVSCSVVSDYLWSHGLAPLPMEFSRKWYCSELPFPSPGYLPTPGIEPGSSALQAGSLPSEPWNYLHCCLKFY